MPLENIGRMLYQLQNNHYKAILCLCWGQLDLHLASWGKLSPILLTALGTGGQWEFPSWGFSIGGGWYHLPLWQCLGPESESDSEDLSKHIEFLSDSQKLKARCGSPQATGKVFPTHCWKPGNLGTLGSPGAAIKQWRRRVWSLRSGCLFTF